MDLGRYVKNLWLKIWREIWNEKVDVSGIMKFWIENLDFELITFDYSYEWVIDFWKVLRWFDWAWNCLDLHEQLYLVNFTILSFILRLNESGISDCVRSDLLTMYIICLNEQLKHWELTFDLSSDAIFSILYNSVSSEFKLVGANS